MKMMNGKENRDNQVPIYSLNSIFAEQIKFQEIITNLKLPTDNYNWSSYHILSLVEEVGELLKADKRWKTHRNKKYDRENKLEELSDIFIILINIILFSGFSIEEIYECVLEKININKERYKNAIDNRGSE